MYISFRLPLLPPRAKNHLAKPPNTKHEKLSSELLTSASQETPRTHSLLLLPLVTPPQRWEVSPYYLRYHILQKQGSETPELELV